MTVYRGERLQPNELQSFQKNIGGYTITNTFLSTTTDRDVACIFAGDGSESPFIESVLLEIKVDTGVKTTKPYAPIQEYSYYETESEILFSLGTRFKIVSVTQEPIDRIWTVELLLVGNFKDNEMLTKYIIFMNVTLI